MKSDAKSVRITIAIGEVEHRKLLERAASRSLAEHRPVALSAVVRDVVKLGLDAKGQAAA